MHAISRFWTQVEMDIGTFDDYENIDLDDITSASIALLRHCVEAVSPELAEESPVP